METKYYFSPEDNKSIKVDGLQIVYYQVKQYDKFRIVHQYGRTSLPDEIRLKAELSGMMECDSKTFEGVVADYYNKERDNASLARKVLFGIKEWP